MSYSLTRGATLAIAVRFASISCAFLLEIVIARSLSVHQYGIYSITVNWLVLLTLLSSLGLDTAAIKTIPYYRAHRQWGELHQFLRFLHNVPLLVSIVMLMVFCGFILNYRGQHSLEPLYPLILAMAILPLAVFASMQGAILRGLMQAIKADAPMGVARPVLIIVAVAIFAALLNGEVAAGHVILAYGGSLLLVIFLYRKFILAEEMGDVSEAVVAPAKYREWLVQAFPMLVVAGMSMLVSRLDVLMIGTILDEKQAGIYAVASRVADLLTVTLVAVNAVVAPKIAHYYALQQQSQLQSLITTTSRITFSATILLIAMILIFEPFILNMFGGEYLAAAGSMHILMIAQAINAFAGSVGYLMLMTGRHWAAARVLGGTALLNIGLNLLLLPEMGIEGAAIAKSVAIVGWNAILLWHVRTYLKVDATPLGMIKP